jgi:cellulose synthase/poly-beta-1,6-N-acetylglucosamine synthase-like glycosyltransferase
VSPRALGLAALVIFGSVASMALTVVGMVRTWDRLASDGEWLVQGVLLALLFLTLTLQLRLLLFILLAVNRLSFLSGMRAARGGMERSWPGVTVIMPAYNEERNLVSGLRSLADLDYPELEIIVVDDGSRDRTGEIARAFAEGRTGGPAIRVIEKPNGGKWAALNLGVREAKHELVLCVDADSRLSRNALRALVPWLDEPTVAAACGQVRVRDRDRLVERLQAVEYLISGLVRAAQHDCIIVVPGPIGLFRKKALLELAAVFGTPGVDPANPGHCAGPFAADTFAEDCDASIRLLTLGWRTVWEPRAIAFTRAPRNFSELLNQRYRWVRGTIQAVLKRPWRGIEGARRPHPWLMHWITWVLGPELFFMPLVALLNIFFFMLALSGGLDFPWGVPLSMVTVDMVLTFLAIDIQEDDWRLLPSVLGFGFYTAFLNVNWIPVVWDQLRGSRMRW